MKIKISKPGVDVLAATSPNDFYLNSDYPLLKIHSYGTFTHFTGGGNTVIYHNLGYKPYVIVFSQAIWWDSSLGDWIITNEYYQHDWTNLGATYWSWGNTYVYDDRIEISVGDTYSNKHFIHGFYYIFKEQV